MVCGDFVWRYDSINFSKRRQKTAFLSTAPQNLRQAWTPNSGIRVHFNKGDEIRKYSLSFAHMSKSEFARSSNTPERNVAPCPLANSLPQFGLASHLVVLLAPVH
jgi:hypothetical protein